MVFDGADWKRAGLVALEPRCVLRNEPDLGRIDAELAARYDPDSDGRTGLAILLDYEAPGMLAFAVDASIVPEGGSRWRLTAPSPPTLDRWSERLSRLPGVDDVSPARASRPTTSLPRESYVQAVRRLQGWIGEGHIYQANLCQRFAAEFDGDPLSYHRALAAALPAPRSAFMAAGGRAVASLSPETFVTLDRGTIETLPIKGTRPRYADPEHDRRAAEELLASSKDRAELLMIVDLERNDLGRICRTGSVEVPELARLASYPTVHHLVARVRGALKEATPFSAMVRAIFPGGSITGAPKKSAMEHIRRVEPVPRGPFTGSLFWCGDDGSIDSSILIRTAVFDRDRVHVGAGGGIVADSEPEAEWAESNHKARALTEALGFQPEDLS
jgi:para-aminobenzoate synthetase component 1